MRTTPKEGPAATLIDHPTRCRNIRGRWICIVRSEGCTEGELVGTVGIINDGEVQFGVAPTDNNDVARRSDNKKNKDFRYKEMFELLDEYHNDTIPEGDVLEKKLATVILKSDPIEKDENSVQTIYNFKKYIYMTFYCSQSDLDTKLILNNNDRKGRVATMEDSPIDCKYKKN